MMERTCLVTKKKLAPSQLLRFTVVDNCLVFDGLNKAPGRGGYVIRSAEALEKLLKLSGKMAYFLRTKRVEVSAEEIERGKGFL